MSSFSQFSPNFAGKSPPFPSRGGSQIEQLKQEEPVRTGEIQTKEHGGLNCRVGRKMDEDQAARIIALQFKKKKALYSYTEMAKGEMYADVRSPEHTNEFYDLRCSTTIIDRGFQWQSAVNFEQIKSFFLSRLSLDDAFHQAIMQRVQQGPLWLVHYTADTRLIKEKNSEKVLELFSYKGLLTRKISPVDSHTGTQDLMQVADSDFVFFSLVAAPNTYLDFNKYPNERDGYGWHSYSFPVDDEYFVQNYAIASLSDTSRQNYIAMSLLSEVMIKNLFLLSQKDKTSALHHLENYKDIYTFQSELNRCILESTLREDLLELNQHLTHHFLVRWDILPCISLLVAYFRKGLIQALKDYQFHESILEIESHPQFSPIKVPDAVVANYLLKQLEKPVPDDLIVSALINGIITPMIKLPHHVVQKNAFYQLRDPVY